MQKGFATLEVILMVMVIGILASIAVPRFTSVTTAANTAKIQSDLSTIDAAIEVYYMENGAYPNAADNITALDDYIRGASDLKPPKGDAYVIGENTPHSFSQDTYKIKAKTNTEGARAYLENESYTAEKFRIEKKSGSTGSGNSGGGTGNNTPTTGN